MRTVFICVFVFAAPFHAVSSTEYIAEDYQNFNVKERAVGRSYSLTTCDYKTQIGYSCLTCNRALHCYIGNNAIIVDCYGIFRYCRDGRCSRHQGEKCGDSSKVTTPVPSNTTIQMDSANDATSEGTIQVVTDVTENVMTTIDEQATTKSDGSTEARTTTKSVSSSNGKANTKSDISTTVDTSNNVV